MPTREQVAEALQRFTGEMSRREGDRYVVDTGVYIPPFPAGEEGWRDPACHSTPRLVENIRGDGVAL